MLNLPKICFVPEKMKEIHAAHTCVPPKRSTLYPHLVALYQSYSHRIFKYSTAHHPSIKQLILLILNIPVFLCVMTYNFPPNTAFIYKKLF